MNGPLLLRTVLLRLGRFKLKTLFMGLGITVSVLATVLLQTAIGSIEGAFTSFIDRAYPADSIVLLAGSGFMGGTAGRNNLKLTDVEAVAGALGSAEWDPMVNAGTRDVGNAGNNMFVSIAGCSEQAERVRRRSVVDGEFFTSDEVRGRAHVALIGTHTAQALFPDQSPVGAQIFVDNVAFEVRGVLEPTGADPHGGDQDNVIWVPYTTLLEMLKQDYVTGATFLIEDIDRAEEIKEEVAVLMRERHQIGEGQEDDFSVITPVFVRNMSARTMKTWALFVPLIAGTAFLISAIVILSIMQVSIKGRIAEIGLRKAVGARSRDVQVQIVLEVLLVSAIASLVGLLLAQLGSTALAPVLAEKFGAKPVSPPVMVVVVAVGAALLTGLVGGLWPARRAAKLNPVQALK